MWSSSPALGSSLLIAIKCQAADSLVSNVGQTPESTESVSDAASQAFRSRGRQTVTSNEIKSADAEGRLRRLALEFLWCRHAVKREASRTH